MRSTRDISLPTVSALMLANLMFIAYGFGVESTPLIVTNA